MPAAALLVAGAAGVFLAVFTLALSVQSLLLERRRAYRTLQAIRRSSCGQATSATASSPAPPGSGSCGRSTAPPSRSAAA
jgi:hypothetical protein